MSVLMEGHMKLFNAFLKDESGAVTVDWVVLTAAIVGLGIAILASVEDGTQELANKISSELANNIDVGTPNTQSTSSTTSTSSTSTTTGG